MLAKIILQTLEQDMYSFHNRFLKIKLGTTTTSVRSSSNIGQMYLTASDLSIETCNDPIRVDQSEISWNP